MEEDKVVPTKAWDDFYWAYNCPLQMWKGDDGWRVVNYVPRKEACGSIDERVTLEEMPQFCRNAAARLRNLAKLFDAMAEGKIDCIYYPRQEVSEAIAEAEQERACDQKGGQGNNETQTT